MFSLWILSLCIGYSFSVTHGSSCDSLKGTWYNQLGSELILSESTEGILNGELRTAVERISGAAGDTYAGVRGISAVTNSATMFAFSAVFNGGSSLTSWIGHCVKCEGEDALQTTWLLKQTVDSCVNQWKSTFINEDIFTHRERVNGPRKHLGTHTPHRSSYSVFRTPSPSIASFQSNLMGKWYTPDGIQLDLSVDDTNGTIEGTYVTPDSRVLPVKGTFDPRNPVGVFALYGVWEDTKSAHTWVGQYHDCDGGKEVLETSWLQRTNVQSCERNAAVTNFGRMTFVRTPPSNNNVGSSWFASSVFSDAAAKISDFFTNLFGK